MHIDKRRVYGLPVAMNVARFIEFCGKVEYGRSRCIFAYISKRLQICWNTSSKVAVGTGRLNSKIIFSAICLVFSWRVTYVGVQIHQKVCLLTFVLSVNST